MKIKVGQRFLLIESMVSIKLYNLYAKIAAKFTDMIYRSRWWEIGNGRKQNGSLTWRIRVYATLHSVRFGERIS